MKLYNTLTRSLQQFEPLAPPKVGIYVCGPTVYDDPHIGHARSAYIFDVLRRYLRHKQYDVTFVRNVTDVDDKIINKAREELGTGRHPAAGGTPVADPPSAGTPARSETGDLQKKCREVAERYLASYHKALTQLGIEPPDVEPRATDHVIPDQKNVEATRQIDASMTGLIGQLITKNMAYPAGGDVYFSVRKFPGYGKLSNCTLDELQAGARVESGEQKQDPLDFALWKAAKPDEPSWSSPWGPGRPGWHIECSLMSTAYLGDAFDIHGGGVDLVFPHHENEMAQAQALGKPFAKYWIHNGLLTVNGEKMSKSLGNIIAVGKAIEASTGGAETLKAFFLGTHYRSPIDYTIEKLHAAGGRLYGLENFLSQVQSRRSGAILPASKPQEILSLEAEFFKAMDEDINTPQALAVLDKLGNLGIRWEGELNLRMTRPGESPQNPPFPHPKERLEKEGKIVQAADTIQNLATILGLRLRLEQPVELTAEQVDRINEREAARKRKDFSKADQIRREFLKSGLAIEDTANGPIVRRQR